MNSHQLHIKKKTQPKSSLGRKRKRTKGRWQLQSDVTILILWKITNQPNRNKKRHSKDHLNRQTKNPKTKIKILSVLKGRRKFNGVFFGCRNLFGMFQLPRNFLFHVEYTCDTRVVPEPARLKENLAGMEATFSCWCSSVHPHLPSHIETSKLSLP